MSFFCCVMQNRAIYSIKIEKYVSNMLYQHDMADWRNKNNQKRMDRIVAKCMEELESHDGLLELLQNDNFLLSSDEQRQSPPRKLMGSTSALGCP